MASGFTTGYNAEMRTSSGVFESEYKKLNKAQREAVEAIEGPVMVVAGPGTGKTQVLALRIANILKRTDIKADGILCLTFTNSAVEAMRSRLEKYIGSDAEKVNVSTFHSFGLELIKKYFSVLVLSAEPKLLEDADGAIFFDKILEGHEWEYLRPRGDGSRYYEDLKSIISLMKRERMTREEFLSAVEDEIHSIENDDKNISSRGATKGELKQEAEKRLESLKRSREVAEFMSVYEATKREQNMLDYDDVLEYMVSIVEKSKDALADVRERYLYVLVDEHQDSSRVQNEFLRKVWGPLERPDIFVVGDDRQLIYGFSGASIEHFQNFKKTFKDAKLVTLVDNYRSTQVILDASHALLASVMTKDKLLSQRAEAHPIRLFEAGSRDEEIMLLAEDLQEKMNGGVSASDCALLVPKNAQVRRAIDILHGLGIPVAPEDALNLFDQDDAQAYLRVLRVLIDPKNTHALAMSFLDNFSGVPTMDAHKFLAEQKLKEFSLENLAGFTKVSLFGGETAVERWIMKLLEWQKLANSGNTEALLKAMGEHSRADTDVGVVTRKEIADTFLKLYESAKSPRDEISLKEFVEYLERLVFYGEHVSMELAPREGVKVLTMHSAKGLEFDYVWIAHMDELSLNSGRRSLITLPERVKEMLLEQDVDAVKRKLFVAITRAKRFCTLSYATTSHKGREQELARVISELPEEIFARQKALVAIPNTVGENGLSDFAQLAGEKYTNRNVTVSLLNNFFECPWKWYFNNLLGIPWERSETLSFGGAVHNALDRILKSSKSPTDQDLDILAEEEARGVALGKEKSLVRFKREIFEILKNFTQNRLPAIAPVHKSEESVSYNDDRFPNLKFYGKIDLVEILNNKDVRVTDFKTGSSKSKSAVEKRDEEGRLSANLRQLAMYSFLLEENPKWHARVLESRLEFLEAKKEKEYFYTTTIGPEERKLLLKDIADYDQLVKTGQWLERPCNYNSYGKATECEYCKIADKYR